MKQNEQKQKVKSPKKTCRNNLNVKKPRIAEIVDYYAV
jgi:hypothetical protein